MSVTDPLEGLGLDLARVRQQNVSRLARWHGEDDDWTLGDWANAMQGEAGEAGNLVKKIRRTESVLWEKQLYPGDSPNGDAVAAMSAEEARAHFTEAVAAELADTVLYADLLAHQLGIDLSAAIVAKFNRVSERQGFPERLAIYYERITHGRHCLCSACADEDWANPALSCGMHGSACPREYQPWGHAGQEVPVASA